MAAGAQAAAQTPERSKQRNGDAPFRRGLSCCFHRSTGDAVTYFDPDRPYRPDDRGFTVIGKDTLRGIRSRDAWPVHPQMNSRKVLYAANDLNALIRQAPRASIRTSARRRGGAMFDPGAFYPIDDPALPVAGDER